MFRLLDPAQFQACFLHFMEDFAEAAQGVIAIDGKTLRRSFDRAAEKSPLHLVSAWAAGSRLVLAQVATDEKSNEITAVPKLLEMLSLNGAIVTADALNCQRAIAAQVVEQGGDYVLALKGNQGTLHDDVRLFLDDPAHASELSVSKPRGRWRPRPDRDARGLRLHQDRLAAGPARTGLGWPRSARSRAPARSTARPARKPRIIYSVRRCSPARFGEVVRAHWGIENSLHWVLDVTMNEDQSRTRKDNGPQNLALLRRWALNACKLEGSKGSIKGKLKRAGWNDDFLARLLTQPRRVKCDSPGHAVVCQIKGRFTNCS